MSSTIKPLIIRIAFSYRCFSNVDENYPSHHHVSTSNGRSSVDGDLINVIFSYVEKLSIDTPNLFGKDIQKLAFVALLYGIDTDQWVERIITFAVNNKV